MAESVENLPCGFDSDSMTEIEAHVRQCPVCFPQVPLEVRWAWPTPKRQAQQ